MEGEVVGQEVIAINDTRPCQATLAATRQAKEAIVVGKERWEEIHRMHQAKMSVSAIARHLQLDRKTVRHWLRQPSWMPYHRDAPTETVLSPYLEWLIQRAPQVRFSARILYQELRKRGYEGSYDTVKLAVRPLRAEASLASLTQQRFETAPGQQAQVDWGEAKVRFAAGVTKVHIFVMTLGYSRRAYTEAYDNERMQSLLSAHERAFAHFGGCCAELLYDRMRTVVQDVKEGRPVWNATFKAFADHWGIEIRACRPYRAQTKGKVESGVKYVKGNFLPGRSFRDLEDFNEQLAQWNQEIADVRLHGTTHQRPIDRFADESQALLPIHGHPSFLEAMVRDRVVASDWLVSIDCNRYSVPCRFIGKTVQVVRCGGQWQIRYRGEIIAEHAVLAGRHRLSVQPEHGPGAAARNARQRFALPGPIKARSRLIPEVEVRDLQVYEQMLEVA